MNWKATLSVLWVMLFVATPSAYATEALCGSHSVLAPDEYCTFYPFIKVGNNDAIIDLSWDALGPAMGGAITPSMVGDYYFYFRDGRLYYLGNTTGAYELFYVFHDGLWYLSDGRAIYPGKPCIVENVTIPSEIRNQLCPCSNVSIKSRSYPIILNGSTLQIIGVNFTGQIELPPSKNLTYTIKLPKNVSLSLPPNVTLRAVFLDRGVLVYTYPMRFDTPLSWSEVRVLYYNGRTLKVLNFTRALENRLPTCKSVPKEKGENVPLIIGLLLLGAGAVKILRIRQR
ncbi:hypothetical protein [Thermococcus sp.]